LKKASSAKKIESDFEKDPDLDLAAGEDPEEEEEEEVEEPVEEHAAEPAAEGEEDLILVPIKVPVEPKPPPDQDNFLVTHRMRWELRDWISAEECAFEKLHERSGIPETRLRNLVFRGDQRLSPDECLHLYQVTGIESFRNIQRIKIFNELYRLISELPSVLVDKISKEQWKHIRFLLERLGVSLKEIGDRADIRPPNRIYNFYRQNKPEFSAKRRFIEVLKEMIFEI